MARAVAKEIVSLPRLTIGDQEMTEGMGLALTILSGSCCTYRMCSKMTLNALKRL